MIGAPKRFITCFVLTKYPALGRLAAVTIADAISRIQFCYPQIYYACHTRHDRARSTGAHLSARDSEILVHLNTATPLTLSELAGHMDLSRSTLSEALTRLQALGYVVKAAHASRDRRHVGLMLTKKGIAAVHAGSVLEARRLRAVLSTLSKADVAAVITGLETLARACGPAIAAKRHKAALDE
jgi:MarR family transcriptional regulator, organic hydroperoxide resistance regulator